MGDESLKGLGPVLLYPEGHGVGQELFKGVRRHSLDAVAIDAGHKLLEAEALDTGARAAQGFCGRGGGQTG